MSRPMVKVTGGYVRGCSGESYTGQRIYKFLGIPYGKPPIGYFRFKAPVPAPNWTGILDATKEGSRCYSKDEKTFQPTGSEDCLYLNVFTKQIPKNDDDSVLKPVMVWVHGGAFTMGSSSPDIYGPEFLLMEDVVVVSINYRLGILGFLSLKDTSLDVPGNAGLKDQTLALKWVKDNIRNFGGDPGNVTIFGESAGAASVHYHVLSPFSKGLFHKAIIQSGTALNSWSLADHHDATKLVGKLNAAVSNEKEALELLRKTPVETLFAAQEAYAAEHNTPSKVSFAPVIEAASVKNPFISRNPLEVIQSGEYNHVPIIFGYNDTEGMFIEGIRRRTSQVNSPEPTLEDLIPWHLNVAKSSDLSRIIVQKFKETYFKGDDLAQSMRLLLTDQMFVAGIIASVKNHAKTTPYPVYLYRVSLETSLNFYKKLCNIEEIAGVCHADELGYLFKSLLTPEEIIPGSIEDTGIKRFVKLWTSFAKLGKYDQADTGLRVNWKPVTSDETNFLGIDKQLFTNVDPDNERVKVWRDIYKLSESPLVINYL